MKAMITSVLWVAGVATALVVQGAPNPDSDSRIAVKPVRVVLVGASIGQAWDLPDLPKRVRSVGYEFEALQEWQYDKSDMLDEVLMRPKRKFHLTRTYLKGFLKPAPEPADVVVLKECSAYFPGSIPIQRQREMVEQWVREISDKNMKVILATAVPVTKARAAQDPGKQESVLAFNDWVREYAKKNGIVLLDLEKTLRSDDKTRFLREEFAIEDGSHVNRKAYDVLDKEMLKAVCAAKPTGDCPSQSAMLHRSQSQSGK